MTMFGDATSPVAGARTPPCVACGQPSACECWEHQFCYPCFAQVDRVLPTAGETQATLGLTDDMPVDEYLAKSGAHYRSIVAKWVAMRRRKEAA